MESNLILVIVVAAALAFTFSNGFQDAGNLIATAVSTGAASPRTAILFVAALNFVGAFISIQVATTVATELVDPAALAESAPLNIVFSALAGAIAWSLVGWRLALPTSSSHALIGGIVGATVAAVGTGALDGAGLLGKFLIPAVVAPVLAFALAALLIALIYRIVHRKRPGPVTRGFRSAQILSGGMLALAHGMNDAQKTMGVVTLALIADGTLGAGADPPFWVIAAAATAIALGTYGSGRRATTTGHTRIVKMDAAQGFSAQGAGAAVILVASFVGIPLSTTQVISGGNMGSGIANRLSAVRWGVAGNIATAWIVTLPAAAAIAAVTFGVTELAGGGAVGPVLICAIALALSVTVLVRRARPGEPVAGG
ncbi:MAG: inorganic phosphate transporter [Solirubrobacterales bacterium]|nr:inorganic phosphate transporter [Solirubrobacterales bacterium]